MQALLLRQLPCCSLPRTLTSAAASTSSEPIRPQPVGAFTGRGTAQHTGGRQLQGQQQLQQARRSVVARITGTRDEYAVDGVRDPEEIFDEDAEEEFLEVDRMPMWSPERGPVHHRIFRDPDEERETKAISIEDTAYWFAENNAGELPRTQWFPRMKEIEPHTADEMLRCEEVEGCPPRLKLSDLQEGDELAGIVSDIWLWHGAFVDVLAEYKGLIPIRQTEWPQVHDSLLPGTEVVVRVHKIYDFPKYRFPLQLELLTPEEVVPQIMAPTDYKVPANVGWMQEQGLDITEVAKELGVHYEDQEYLLEPDHADWMEDINYSYEQDPYGTGRVHGEWLLRELDSPGMEEELQKAAAREGS